MDLVFLGVVLGGVKILGGYVMDAALWGVASGPSLFAPKGGGHRSEWNGNMWNLRYFLQFSFDEFIDAVEFDFRKCVYYGFRLPSFRFEIPFLFIAGFQFQVRDCFAVSGCERLMRSEIACYESS